MANYDIAMSDLDEMIHILDGDIKRGGFDNDSVIYLIKAWTKIVILARGTGNGYHKRLSAYYIMKRKPTEIKGKRSKDLSRALDNYNSMLEKKVADGDWFNRADKAMLDFVWDYRQHISGDREKDFVNKLSKWMGLSEEDVMKQEIFQMDRSI